MKFVPESQIDEWTKNFLSFVDLQLVFIFPTSTFNEYSTHLSLYALSFYFAGKFLWPAFQ